MTDLGGHVSASITRCGPRAKYFAAGLPSPSPYPYSLLYDLVGRGAVTGRMSPATLDYSYPCSYPYPCPYTYPYPYPYPYSYPYSYLPQTVSLQLSLLITLTLTLTQDPLLTLSHNITPLLPLHLALTLSLGLSPYATHVCDL